METHKFTVSQILRFIQELQPILCLICFLQRNFQLCNKICRTLRPLSFCNICSNAGATFADLLRQNIFMLPIDQIFLKIYDPNRKSKALSYDHILFHQKFPRNL